MADNLTIFDKTADYNAPDVWDIVNRMMADLHVAAGLRTKEAYTLTTAVTALTNDVKFFENNFYIPDGVTEFSFTDDGVDYIWTYNVDTWDVSTEVAYSPDGAITDISDGVTFDTDHFIVPDGVTSFTFTDDGADMEATFDVTWSFAEAVDPAEALLASANVQARFVAEEGNLTHGSPVSQWNDISGNGRHLTQATPDAQPAWDAVNQEVVLATGTTLDRYDFVGDPDFLPQPFSVFLVVKLISKTDNGTIFNGYGTSVRIYQASSDRLRVYGGAGPITVDPGLPTLDNYYVVRCVANGENSSLQVNADTKATGDVGPRSLNYGLELNSNGLSNIAYKEVIVWDGVISDSDSDLIYDKLVADHSIVV